MDNPLPFSVMSSICKTAHKRKSKSLANVNPERCVRRPVRCIDNSDGAKQSSTTPSECTEVHPSFSCIPPVPHVMKSSATVTKRFRKRQAVNGVVLARPLKTIPNPVHGFA